MSQSHNTRRAILALGLASFVGATATTNASAAHFGGFGGGHMSVPHFGGGGGFGGHPSFAPFNGGSHFSAPHGSFAHPSRAFAPRDGGRHFGHLPRDPRGHGTKVGGNHEPKGDKGNKGEHPRGPRWPQVGGHCGPWHHHCGPIYGRGPYPVYPPVYGDQPPAYDAPVPVYTGSPSYSVPPVPHPYASPAPVNPSPTAPKTCEAPGTFITIVFQPTATAASITAFLKEYDVAMADGPNADGMYRIKISSETEKLDQFDQMIESMRSKKDVVASIDG